MSKTYQRTFSGIAVPWPKKVPASSERRAPPRVCDGEGHEVRALFSTAGEVICVLSEFVAGDYETWAD